jgi:hypothetical protein
MDLPSGIEEDADYLCSKFNVCLPIEGLVHSFFLFLAQNSQDSSVKPGAMLRLLIPSTKVYNIIL